jgi:hypothetical protein
LRHLHDDGVVVSHLFPAVDIGVTGSSVAEAVFLGAVVPWVETKMAPTTTTVATTNETRHGTPSPRHPILVRGRARAMRARMAVVVVGGVGKDAIVAAAINRRHSRRCRHGHRRLNPTAAAIDNDR